MVSSPAKKSVNGVQHRRGVGESTGVELTEIGEKGLASQYEETEEEDEGVEAKALLGECGSGNGAESKAESNSSGGATSGQVAVNIIISFVGAGLLGMPQTFQKSGWLLGSLTLCTVSALNVYTMLLLPKVRREVASGGHDLDVPAGVNVNTYSGLGRVILGRKGEALIEVCLVISQCGFATAYIIFIAANAYSIAAISRGTVCLAAVPGLALLVQAQDMKSLAPFSLLADVANFIGLSAVLMEDFHNYHPHNDTVHAVKWDGLWNVIAITVYSMEGVGLILSIEGSCNDRAKFPSLFKTVLACITLFMTFFGSLGYWAFGDNTQAPITLNLQGSAVATFVKTSLCVALYLTYPVMMFPVWTIVEDRFLCTTATLHNSNNTNHQTTHTPTTIPKRRRIILRTKFVLATALVAYAVPDFGKFLSLVGSSICTILGFILPCWFHMKVFKVAEMEWYHLYLDVFLIVGGALFGMFGTYKSALHLITGEGGTAH